MRVISGKYKGKKLKGFDINGTRPTMNRVKESLFGMLSPFLKGSECLDLFAGVGALGIEAISNGARSITFVDNNIRVINTLKENTKNMDDDIHIILSDYKKYIKTCNKKFDIIFLDPPYDRCLITKAINYIIEYDIISAGGIIVCEYENEEIKCNLNMIKEKSYGNKHIKIFQK